MCSSVKPNNVGVLVREAGHLAEEERRVAPPARTRNSGERAEGELLLNARGAVVSALRKRAEVLYLPTQNPVWCRGGRSP